VTSLFAGPEPICFLFVRHVKGSEYGNGPQSADDLKKSIQNIVLSVS
jgi:hypothetical protein